MTNVECRINDEAPMTKRRALRREPQSSFLTRDHAKLPGGAKRRAEHRLRACADRGLPACAIQLPFGEQNRQARKPAVRAGWKPAFRRLRRARFPPVRLTRASCVIRDA